MVDIPPGPIRSGSIWVATEAEILHDVREAGEDGAAALSKQEGRPGGI